MRRFELTAAGFLLISCGLPAFPVTFAPSCNSASSFVARTPGGNAALTGAGIRLPDGAGIEFLGANAHSQGEGEVLQSSVTNCVIGRDPRQWRLGLANFQGVRFPSVYPGIDVRYHGEADRLEYDFVVSPGADPSQIRVLPPDRRFAIRQLPPQIYQEVRGIRKPVSGGWRPDRHGVLSFELGVYDRGKSLVIDPVVLFATYLGGSGYDTVQAVTADAAGNVYVAGMTQSNDFPGAPTAGSAGSQRGFVVKLNPEGTRILYSTTFGGTGSGSVARALTIDGSGNVYVTGYTDTPDFPATTQAFQKSLHGFSDAFLMKLDPSGAPVYSSYLGGGQMETANAIAVDSGGYVYVAGGTSSLDFPVTTGAFQTTTPHGPIASFTSGFLAKVTPDGSALVFSTYLGGSGNFDLIVALAVDAAGSAVVTGATSSNNFPVTTGAVQTTFFGTAFDNDAFITKFNAAGSALVYSTFYGGQNSSGNAIAVDGAGNAYVGCNSSLLKLDPGGTLRYAEDTGGLVFGIALDEQNHVFLTGNAGPSFSVTLDALPFRPVDTAGFLEEFDSSGVLQLATYLSPFTGAVGESVAIAGQTALVAGGFGLVASTPGAFQESPTGGFIIAIDLSGRAHLEAIWNAATLSSGGIAPGELVVAHGAGFTPDATVAFDGSSVQPIVRTSTDLTAVAPAALQSQTSVQVVSGGAATNALTIPVVDAAPALFPGKVRNADGSQNSPANPAARGSQISLLGTGLGVRSVLTVYFDGFVSSSSSAAPAPGSPGIFQVTVTVPDDAPPSSRVSVYLAVGQAASQAVTVAVK